MTDRNAGPNRTKDEVKFYNSQQNVCKELSREDIEEVKKLDMRDILGKI